MPNYSGIWTEQAMMQAVAAGTWSSVPGAPTIGTATATGATSASVAFTAPGFAGIPATITSYTVTSSPGNITATGTSSPIAITGLTEGTPYTFRVTATNASGTGTASAASNSVTPVPINYIEEVFSTWLYTGNGSTQTITNGIDFSGKGGLLWLKARSTTGEHALFDTLRGTGTLLNTDSTNAARSETGLASFNTDGFSFAGAGSTVAINFNGRTFASWSFREQPKFFDVVTYTGNGVDGRAVAHNLQSTPGCVIAKCTSNAGEDWRVHFPVLGNNSALALNLTIGVDTNAPQLIKSASSTTFTLGNDSSVNASGRTYVAYLFASNAGGFGTSGNDNVITCGSYTGNGGLNEINLGFEAQWVLVKSTGVENWMLYDNMRGMANNSTGSAQLFANLTNAEQSGLSRIYATATGFGMNTSSSQINTNGQTYIYIAIRRGPMKVPTTGTSVFYPKTWTGTATTTNITDVGFPPDFFLGKKRSGSFARDAAVFDRLRGTELVLYPSGTVSEQSQPGITSFSLMTGYQVGAFDNVNSNTFFGPGQSYIHYSFRRAPSFMDVVCYTGTGNVGSDATRITHNLGVAPELIIVKGRTNTVGWPVYSAASGVNSYLLVNTTDASSSITGLWATTAPTATTFGVSNGGGTFNNGGGVNYVAYLFASAPGVSKVGSYTGTGSTQVINCGFAAGARFVLIKSTSTTGDWLYWDTARGMIPSNDPYLVLNTTADEVTGTDWVDTAATGFELSSNAGNLANSNGVSYIFLAIA